MKQNKIRIMAAIFATTMIFSTISSCGKGSTDDVSGKEGKLPTAVASSNDNEDDDAESESDDPSDYYDRYKLDLTNAHKATDYSFEEILKSMESVRGEHMVGWSKINHSDEDGIPGLVDTIIYNADGTGDELKLKRVYKDDELAQLGVIYDSPATGVKEAKKRAYMFAGFESALFAVFPDADIKDLDDITEAVRDWVDNSKEQRLIYTYGDVNMIFTIYNWGGEKKIPRSGFKCSFVLKFGDDSNA